VVKALVFDVFGTCVDWRGSVIRSLRATGFSADWEALSDEWRREGYIAPIRRILAGEEPYVSSDVLFRRKLAELLPRYGVTLAESEVDDLARSWRRLDPWPDTVPGLTRLKQKFTIAPLSNGTFATLTEIAKRGGMPWDCIISTELRRTYKPAREAYLLAAELLDVEPHEVMLVAAHNNDLQGARQAGLRTALVLVEPEHRAQQEQRRQQHEADQHHHHQRQKEAAAELEAIADGDRQRYIDHLLRRSGRFADNRRRRRLLAVLLGRRGWRAGGLRWNVDGRRPPQLVRVRCAQQAALL
jgi:2-haloacid dehalogenase